MFHQTFYYGSLLSTVIKVKSLYNQYKKYIACLFIPLKERICTEPSKQQKIIWYIAHRIKEQAVQAMKTRFKLLLENFKICHF